MASELSPANPAGQLEARVTPSITWAQDAQLLQYQTQYTLGIADEASATIFEAVATFVLSFVGVTESIDPDVATAFGNTSVVIMANPYARELFSTLTVRAGLTAFVLPPVAAAK